MTTLSNATLDQLPAEVSRPTYNRDEIKVGIVHFGVGAFHRSHMALNLDRLMNAGQAHEWGIAGVGLMVHDNNLGDAMREQDCLYTLITKHADGRKETAVIGSIVKYLYAPDDPSAVLEQLADPDVKIVSMTITEGGYNFDASTGEFMADTPAVAADLKPGAVPSTIFGYVFAALKLRRDRGLEPFTVMTCDNIQANGDMARRIFSTFGKLKDAAFGEWMETNVSFPNSMVDRITPRTTAEDVELAAKLIGMKDSAPVVCEPFFQWAIDDQFPIGRPAFENAGAQMVHDVMPYELMKLRNLNVGHQGLCYFGYLSGYRLVHEAMQDQLISKFILRYMMEEATPTLLPVPGVDLVAYQHELVERFSNPEVRDTVARLCNESSDRIPKWLVPVIEHNVEHGGPVKLSAAIVASWARYAEGTDEQGNPIDVSDNNKEEVMKAAAAQRTDKLAFLRNKKFFGNLVDDKRFTDAYVEALDSLIQNGAQATLKAIV
jgi:mannitol 2-dehydrogenase